MAAAFQPRFWDFRLAMEHLIVPRGTSEALCLGCDVAGNFNRGLQRMEGRAEPRGWAWFLGDDHSFRPDTLMRLLAHQRRVVVPVNVVKILPFRPLVFHGPYKPERMTLYRWEELSEPGLFALPDGDFTGQAGMLVQRPVLDRLGYPWFKTGMFDQGRLQEDLWFIKDLQAQGETIWIDRDLVLDHIFHATISARRNDDGEYEPVLRSGKVQIALGNMEPVQKFPDVVPEVARPPLEWAEVPA